MKVRVKNFQSIKDAEVDIEGFTVITGPNNSGKTALIRALRGAFQNTSGTGFVRHGEKSCRVEVDLGPEEGFAWEKKATGKASYEFGSKVVHPGKSAIPQEVSDLGVCSIDAGSEKIWPQIANQFTGQVFLVDQTGSALAEAVADVERVGKLNRALKGAESDLRSANSELKVRKKDLKAFEEELLLFEGVDKVQETVASVEALLEKTSKIGRAVTGLSVMRDRLVSATATVSQLSGVRTDFVSLDQTEAAPRDLKVLDLEIKDLKILEGRIDLAGREFQIVADAFAATQKLSFPDTAKAEKVAKSINLFQGILDRLSDADDTIGNLREHLQVAQSDLDSLNIEINETLGELGECPVCGTDTHTNTCSVEMGGAL